ncbi:MAG: CocE/NonD family hydrolase [Actinomycetota bacterium]
MLPARAIVRFAAPFVLIAGTLVRAPAAGSQEAVTGYTKPIYTQSVTEEYRVPTEHGTIFGLVKRPVVPAGVQVPTILTYSPYNFDDRPTNQQTTITDSIANFYVPRGYARAHFDLVGTRESSGCYDFGGIRERETGAAVIDYLGELPWSNGRVGMIGASYDGTTQYAAAIEAPEHLTTIVPQVAIDRWYDYPYDGGVRRFSGFGTPLLFDFEYGATPPTGINDPEHLAEVATTRVNPCDRVEHQIRGFGWDPVWDAFWDERDYRVHADKVQASVLVEGGWLDNNVQLDGSVKFFQALPDDHPKKIVMGQWGHAVPTLPDWNGIRHAWFDYWLYDYDGEDDDDDLPDTGVMEAPRMDSVMSGSGERVQLDSWPPATTTTIPLRLVGQPATSTEELGVAAGTDTTYSNNDPSLNQSQVMSGNCRDACVAFVGPELEEDVVLAGTPYLDLAARSAALGAGPGTVSTQYVVIAFVLEGATRRVISVGMLNSRNRDGLRSSADVPEGLAYRSIVELNDLHRYVSAGSRIGVAFAGVDQSSNLAPDDDPPTANTILVDHAGGLGTVLRIPVESGHAAFHP